MPRTEPRKTARDRILEVALRVIREKGYGATSIDDLCVAADVTKGAFFHHFASKEQLAVQAAERWSALTSAFFEAAPYHKPASARDRVLGYVDFRLAILQGRVADYTCLVGTMVQEVHMSSTAIRDACAKSMLAHAATLEADLAEALARSGRGVDVDAHGLALHIQAGLQGAFILAKATQDAAVAARSIRHLRTYLDLLLSSPRPVRRPAAVPRRKKTGAKE